MAAPTGAALDFEALLSRDYRPALVTRLIPREKYKGKDDKKNNPAKKPVVPLSDDERRRREIQEETSRLVLELVAQTPAFTQHGLPEGERPITNGLNLLTERPLPNRSAAAVDEIEPAFHEVELGDWESKINWEGIRDDADTKAASKPQKFDPMELLEKKRNPYLDNLKFDNTTVSWDGDTAELLEKAKKAPLILELGVAGQSVARHVYQNTVLSAQRPTPALRSEAYRNRVERDWAQPVSTAAETTKGSLHADKDQQAAVIEKRQKKRAQMEVDKTTRVAEAMGTIMTTLGGGRGRTVTSSLMGPGGTERTGRPSRALASGIHEAEYVEQLDLINNHALIRADYPKVIQREYMRPKLPLSVVRPDLAWQFQINYIPTGKKSDSPGQSSSYQAIMLGAHAGAISKEKLRTVENLSPTEGDLILLEYSEERPPIQLTKGMCSKIVNYYRGDKARCPVSAGGGDRPARRKRGGDGATGGKNGAPSTSKNDRLPRLEGPNQKTTIMDWVGKIPKKSQKDRTEADAFDVLPEGATEILHPKVHGPFIGPVEEGETVTGLISNLFVAPMFRHEPESTDFLMILSTPGGLSRPGQRESMGVILRELPSSVFCVGQTEPRTKVNAPNTPGEKAFMAQFLSYQIARALNRAYGRDGHGLRYDELQDRVLPSLDLPGSALRQRLKQVAVYDKNTQIWTPKRIDEDYPGIDALGRKISPESVASFEAAGAASRRLMDLGIQQLLEKGSNTVVSVGVAIVYLAGQLNAAREISRKTKKLGELSKSNRKSQNMQVKLYERASKELEDSFKSLRQRHEIAQFIYEELQLAPWHLTGEFIEVHKKGEGTGMMKLTGIGDPSGLGEGFSFIREVDPRPGKAVGNGALNADMKKITGTEADLRKMTMKEMAALLRSYNMPQKDIDRLKRWDRVHVIRDLSTRAANDGIGDGLERFARGEKIKLSEQKKMYSERIKVIWKRQLAALSAPDREIGSAVVDNGGAGDIETEAPTGSEAALKKSGDTDKVDSESDSDDDDLAAALEDEMMDTSEVNQLVSAHARGSESEGGLGQLRAATRDQDLTKDARELAALKRQREEERVAKEGLKAMGTERDAPALSSFAADQKVIRKRITRTHPDGRQTTTFKFILHPEEVAKIMVRLAQNPDKRQAKRETKYEYGADEKPPGHSMFEDEDDFEYSSKGRLPSGRRRPGGRRRGGGRATPRNARTLQYGKLKTKMSTEERLKKRRREEEEMEVYSTSSKRRGTSNRSERGSIRDRRPHVIFAKKLEVIRASVESRPAAGPFRKPVNPKLIPKYYEVISHPIDLSTIRDKIARYDYRTADALIADFELMKMNAVKFNGPESQIALEAVAIYDFVKDQVEASRKELTALEEDVSEILDGKPKKKKIKTAGKNKKKPGKGAKASPGGFSVNLGELSAQFAAGSDSGSDDSLDL